MACSIVSKPASIAMPTDGPTPAWMAHLRSSRWVSSTAAFSSSWVYSGRVITRWLLISLIQSAPARSCLRMTLRISSTPSATSHSFLRLVIWSPWPPVIVSPRSQWKMRGMVT